MENSHRKHFGKLTCRCYRDDKIIVIYDYLKYNGIFIDIIKKYCEDLFVFENDFKVLKGAIDYIKTTYPDNITFKERVFDGLFGFHVDKNMLYDEIYDYNDRISDMTDKLTKKEDNYYKKFAALEQAISKMNSQSSWLSSQLGTGGG